MRHISEFGYVLDHSIWLTPTEYATLHGCGLQTLYNKKHKNELPEAQIVTDGYFWWIHKDADISSRRTTR